MPSNFVHLHVHSHYSLLDGAATVPALLKRAKDLDMPALALTDHGNMYGAVEFYEEAKKIGIKPILGYEAYIAFGDLRIKKSATQKDDCYHLTLLAMNSEGFHNLIQLATVASLEGFYRKPRIDKELLSKHHEGLICLSGCASGELSAIINEQKSDSCQRAKEVAVWYQELFGDRYYIELQDQGIRGETDENTNIDQRLIVDGCAKLAEELGIPTAATNDVHYVNKGEHINQEILKKIASKGWRGFGSQNFFMRSEKEMLEALPGYEDAVARTVEIAARCNCELDLKARHFPSFTPPDGSDSKDYLRKLTYEGLNRRYAANPKRFQNGQLTQDVLDRAERELNVITAMGFENYFLVVGDFVRHAEELGIHRTARGSGVGSIVCYAMNIMHVCPLEYDLLFERFLDPSRPQAPDIDIDFDDKRREEVLDYVKEKYGESNVARLVTFQTLAAKGAVKDTGRVLDMPIPFVNEIAAVIDNAETIDAALKDSAELNKRYENEPSVKQLLDEARRVEGLVRGTGVHACGVVISGRPIIEFAPLQYAKMKEGDDGDNKETFIVTQWEGHPIEAVGLLKMDFLGLKNLGILANCIEIIKETTGKTIDVYNLPIDDAETYKVFQRGETKGVFQFESGGMREWLIKLQPDNIRDLIAMNALYRPGPMDNIPQYIDVKHGRKQAVYEHPVLEEVLSETYGVIIYQEQIMRLFNRLGNIPLGASYDVIKAISKKNEGKIAKSKSAFVEGARSNGLDKKKAEEIFENIAKFAGYGFNKSHSTAYAFFAYMTGYLKAHYPNEYLAAVLSSDMLKRNLTGKDALVEHIEDCQRMNLEIVPPDINTSLDHFSVKDGKITFGLTAIARCGERAMQSIVAEREKNGNYTSLFELCERVPNSSVNKGALESLVKAGAFDKLEPNRAALFAQVDGALKLGQNAAADAARGQKSIFGMLDDTDRKKPAGGEIKRTVSKDWDAKEKATNEKEVLGFYLTENPMKEFEEMFALYRSCSNSEAAALKQDAQVCLAGTVNALVTKQYKKPREGKPATWAGFDFEDGSGSIRSIMWADEFARYADKMQSGGTVIMRGRIDRAKSANETSADGNFVADEFYTLDEAVVLITGLKITLDEEKHNDETIQQLAALLTTPLRNPSPLNVDFAVRLRNGSTAFMPGGRTAAVVTPDLKCKVDRLLGTNDAAKVLLKPFKQRENRNQWGSKR